MVPSRKFATLTLVKIRMSVEVFGLGPAHRKVVRHTQTVRDVFMPQSSARQPVRKG
jgi:hypothetical protein